MRTTIVLLPSLKPVVEIFTEGVGFELLREILIRRAARFGCCLRVVRTIPEIEVEVAAGDRLTIYSVGFQPPYRGHDFKMKHGIDPIEEQVQNFIQIQDRDERSLHLAHRAAVDRLASVACAWTILASRFDRIVVVDVSERKHRRRIAARSSCALLAMISSLLG